MKTFTFILRVEDSILQADVLKKKIHGDEDGDGHAEVGKIKAEHEQLLANAALIQPSASCSSHFRFIKNILELPAHGQAEI